jgi:hypothetical protein
MSGKANEKNVKSGQQGTVEPWKRPGQASQEPARAPPEKQERERTDKDNETS